MFRLKQCWKVVSPTTEEEWTVPSNHLVTDEGGTWLHLRLTCMACCRLIVANARSTLHKSKAVKEIIKKRNEVHFGPTAGKSLFDDSDEEQEAAPAAQQPAKRRKVQKTTLPLSVEIELEPDKRVVLRAPKRRDSDLWVRCDDANLDALLQHLAAQVHEDEDEVAGAKRRGRKPKA